MQSVSDDDVPKRLLAKPRFELVAKDWADVTLPAGRSRSSRQQLEKHGYRRLIGDRLTGGTRRRLVPNSINGVMPLTSQKYLFWPRYLFFN